MLGLKIEPNSLHLHDAMNTKRGNLLHTENVQSVCHLRSAYFRPHLQLNRDQGLRSSSCTVWASLGSLLMPWIHLALIRTFSRLCFSVLSNSGFLRVAKKRENSAAFSLEVNWWPEIEELDRSFDTYIGGSSITSTSSLKMTCGLKFTNVTTYLIKPPACVSPYFLVTRSQLSFTNTRTNVK